MKYGKRTHLFETNSGETVYTKYKGRRADKSRGDEEDVIMNLIYCWGRIGTRRMISSPVGQWPT